MALERGVGQPHARIEHDHVRPALARPSGEIADVASHVDALSLHGINPRALTDRQVIGEAAGVRLDRNDTQAYCPELGGPGMVARLNALDSRVE